MPVLVIGRNGQLARALARLGPARGHQVICAGRDDVDILSEASVARLLARADPFAIINAAAYTAVDRAETERDAAHALNEHAPRLLATLAAERGLPFLHLSTDYVFDGTKPAPYLPEDPIQPVNAYGASKAAGETAVRGADPTAIILRTAWVYGDTGTNFVRRMLELGRERDELSVVHDQIGNPTFADDLAGACLQIAARAAEGKGDAGGLYHYAGAGDTSWHGFAQAIFAQARRRQWRAPERLIAIPTAQYPTPARRPANSRLDCTKTEECFGITRRPWRESLAACLDRIAADS